MVEAFLNICHHLRIPKSASCHSSGAKRTATITCGMFEPGHRVRSPLSTKPRSRITTSFLLVLAEGSSLVVCTLDIHLITPDTRYSGLKIFERKLNKQSRLLQNASATTPGRESSFRSRHYPFTTTARRWSVTHPSQLPPSFRWTP